MRIAEPSSKPWYREPWPWLLMAGPALVVVAGFVTLWLAVASDDGLVAGDYYKRGLAINQVLSRETEARARGLRARLVMDAGEGRVQVTLAGKELPPVLRLHVVHPTRAGLDQASTLAAIGTGVYEGRIGTLPAGRWRLYLEDGAGSWRLTGAWRVPGEAEVELTAHRKENP